MVPSGWWLDSLACADPDGGSTTDLVAAKATIDLDLGEAITCSFTNLPEPRMSLLATATLLTLGALYRHRKRAR